MILVNLEPRTVWIWREHEWSFKSRLLAVTMFPHHLRQRFLFIPRNGFVFVFFPSLRAQAKLLWPLSDVERFDGEHVSIPGPFCLFLPKSLAKKTSHNRNVSVDVALVNYSCQVYDGACWRTRYNCGKINVESVRSTSNNAIESLHFAPPTRL